MLESESQCLESLLATTALDEDEDLDVLERSFGQALGDGEGVEPPENTPSPRSCERK
jgi:hypothetical protein